MKNLNKSLVFALLLGIIGFIAGWQIYAPDLSIKLLFGATDSLIGNMVSDSLLGSTRTKVWIVAGVGALLGFIIGMSWKRK